MRSISLLKQEKGGTAIIFLFIMSMLAALAVGALQVTSLNLESSHAHRKGKQAFYAAEVGLDLAANAIVTSFQNLVTYTSTAQNGGDGEGYITVNNYRGHDVKYRVTPVLTGLQNRFLYQTTKGQDILTHYAYTYDIDAISTSLSDNSTETLRERIRILETPLIQWFIFYSGQGGAADLEIHSGSNWTGWGRIHTNGNFYIGSTQGAFHRFQNFDPNGGNPIQTPHAITVSGNIINDTKVSNFLVRNFFNPFGENQYNFTVNADAQVKTTNVTTVWEDQQTIDKNITTANQVAEEARFNDFVLAQEQPRQTPGPIIIQRNGFYENRSIDPQQPGVDGIRILGQGGFVPGGFQVTVSRPAPNTDVTALIAAGQTSPGNNYAGPMPIISESVNDFGDCRENRQVSTTNIDMNALTLWYQQYLADPANGGGALGQTGFLVYASRSPNVAFTNLANPMQAIRLQGGLGGGVPVPQLQGNATFATDNPLYIQGDFNTVNKVGVALIADAINVLSKSWAGKNCNNTAPFVFTSTSVNAAFITGNSVSTANFEGGAINYPRFNEWWRSDLGSALNYSGAFINLWVSQQANGNWCLGGNCYSAPIRNWGWETNFQDPNFWPPFIPSVYEVERVGFLE